MRAGTFWIALSVIIVSWIANSVYAHSQKIDSPIFLDHYMNISQVDSDYIYITLYYLTNKDDQDRILSANLNGLAVYPKQEEAVIHFDHDPQTYLNKQTFTHHALREIHLQIPTLQLEELYDDEGIFHFEEIDLYLSTGDPLTVSIGDVTIHHSTQDDNPFEGIGASSGGNWDAAISRVKETLEITDISFQHEDILQENFTFKINHTNSGKQNPLTFFDDFNENEEDPPGTNIDEIKFPIKLEEGDIFYLYSQMDPDFIGFIDSFIHLSGITENGEEFTISSWISSQQPYLQKKDVKRLIQQEKEGDPL